LNRASVAADLSDLVKFLSPAFGFGFVRFSEQSEQMISLQTMQGRVGLGERPMKVSIAYVKGKDGSISYPTTQPEDLPETTPAVASQGYDGQNGQAADYAAQWQQYNQYWQQYAAWQQYYAAQGQAGQPAEGDSSEAAAARGQVVDEKVDDKKHQKGSKLSIFDGNLKEVVQNNVSPKYEVLNQEYLERSEEFYSAVENSRWWED